MTDFDPYEVLGLDGTADPAAIKAAYRRRARTLHPDANGSAEAFDLATKARDILLDPERRRRFDETGTVDDGDRNAQVYAMEIIISAVNARIDAFVAGGFSPDLDPARIDLPAVIRGEITKRIAETRRQISVGKMHVKTVRSAMKRFHRRTKGKTNFIKASLDLRAAAMEHMIRESERQITCEEDALRLLEDFDFRRDDVCAFVGGGIIAMGI